MMFERKVVDGRLGGRQRRNGRTKVSEDREPSLSSTPSHHRPLQALPPKSPPFHLTAT